MARTPEKERRNVIAAFSWAYCEPVGRDVKRTFGMYLLLRVLFILPEGELSGPVHSYESAHVLRIDAPPAQPVPPRTIPYSALWEYDHFSAQFRMRTVAELEALEIR
jgi:hypothetical protein